MTSKVVYNGNLRTEAVHLKSGQKIITDAPTDNNGKGQSFSPTDLVATSLASCILTIMGIAAKSRNINIDNASIEVEKIMASHPRRIDKIKLKIEMPSNDYSKSEMAILTKAAHNCPVHLSLNNELKVDLDLIWK